MLHFSSAAFAQKGFYIRGGIEVKKDHYKSIGNLNNPYQTQMASGFNITFQHPSWGKINGLNFIWGIGYINKNYFIETGLGRDWVGVGSNVSYELYGHDSLPYFGGGSGSHSSATEYWNIPLRFGYKLYNGISRPGRKVWRWDIYGTTAINGLIKGNLQSNNLDVTEAGIGEILFISISRKPNHIGNNVALQGSVGFMFKAYNKRNVNVLNVGLSYGYRPWQKPLTEMEIRVVDFNNEVVQSRVFGDNSGIYISLSRDLFPFELVKPKEQRYRN